MLKLGKQMESAGLWISAFWFPNFCFLLPAFPPSLFIRSDRA